MYIDKKELPWIEKHRPDKINDIIHQENIVKVMNKLLESGDITHMLFYGGSGIGKTTMAIALCKQLYGLELFRERVLELNASDERGIKTVRGKIKNFSKSAITKKKINGYTCPLYKIIILDEADAMTDKSQLALRRIME